MRVKAVVPNNSGGKTMIIPNYALTGNCCNDWNIEALGKFGNRCSGARPICATPGNDDRPSCVIRLRTRTRLLLGANL